MSNELQIVFTVVSLYLLYKVACAIENIATVIKDNTAAIKNNAEAVRDLSMVLYREDDEDDEDDGDSWKKSNRINSN